MTNLPDDIDELIRAAAAARENAHAPYSGFKVGACLRGEDGRLYVGCNVENVAYPQGQCAEASAIGTMIAAGCRRILEVVVLAEGEHLCTPCGGCRQKLAEFAGPDTPVHIADGSGVRASYSLDALLPYSFTFEKGAE